MRVLYGSLGIIGNSSVAIREASFLGAPAVNVGSRQNARERGPNVVDVGYNENEIYDAVIKHCTGKTTSSPLYGDGDAGIKIADILAKTPLTFTKTLNY